MIEVRVTCDFPGCGESAMAGEPWINAQCELRFDAPAGWSTPWGRFEDGDEWTDDIRCPTHRAGTQEGK